MTTPKRSFTNWSAAVILAAALVAPFATPAPEQSQNPLDPRPSTLDPRLPLARFLVPPPIQNQLELSDDQKAQVAKLAQQFVAENRQTLAPLAADLDHTMTQLQQARQKQDRAAFRQGQERLRDLIAKLAKIREQLEPSLLSAFNDQQKKQYQQLKPELMRPAALFNMDRGSGRDAPSAPQRREEVSNLKPLTDMGDTEYHGFKGGLYPDGRNERPAAQETAGRALAAKIKALDASGQPSAKGKIVLLTIGMSNTMQASAGFKEVADADPDLNPQLVIVNGAQGGQTAARTQDPDDHATGAAYWATVDERLKSAGVTRVQVQAVWVKQADAAPTQGFPEYAKTLENELVRIMQVLCRRFPNLKLVYLSSRTYGGFATTRLNPEPYAYESGWSVKWLIGRQVNGDPALNFDPANGPVTAPWLSWGPYLWANGPTKRADGFYAEQTDFRDTDGTHESRAGQLKVGKELLKFFKNDTTTRDWFVKAIR